ncbi:MULTISPECIES: phosphotransferase family protein [unclassified Novosphingobium]|uniref:phosphotransferase family protein n=1 Tax=unclassified Novosphingobium TaxID=2644732 RepID=UPI001359BDD3|nr:MULTISPECIES: phosphotransferase family protein [unclassified Novosphingobium]
METFPDFCTEWFVSYMNRRKGQAVTVDRFERFTRGTSRQTWFVHYRGEDGAPQSVTIRTDHPAGAGDPTSLDQEFAIYDRLGRMGLPTARALYWEEDPASCPRPFFARELIDGSWQIGGYALAGEDGARIRFAAAQEHMRALAAVHDADWRAVGFAAILGAPEDEADAARFYVRRQRALLAEFGAEPQPLLAEVARVLLEGAPSAGRVSLCKGTNGLGEEVFRDGRIVALSDWEEAWIGDPASDLAMVQGFTEVIVIDGETVWDLDRAVAYYNQVAAVPVTMENVRYYQLARMFGRLVMFAYTTTVVQRSANATVRQSWTATEVQHAVKRVLAHALGLGEGPDPALFEELNQSVEMQAQEAAS